MKKSRISGLVIILMSLLFLFYGIPFLSFQVGKHAFNKKEYVKAFKSLSYAYHMHKGNSNYRYYYVQTMLHFKPLLQVQKDMFEIAQSDYDDAARSAAVRKVKEWRSNIKYNSGNNYIYNVPSEKGIVRWDTKKFPIKIAVENADKVPGYYKTEIISAFMQWSNSVQHLKFSLVKKAANADIVVTIAPLPNNVCNEQVCQYVVGYTVPTIKHRILKKMTITLYDKDPNGQYFSDKELFNTVLHEIGHALGIMGHSYNEGDLMFVSTTADNKADYLRARSSFQYLTDNDINTLNLLYKLIPDVSNTPREEMDMTGMIYAPIIIGTSKEMHERKLQEAQAYIQEAPDMASGYIDLAIAYSELGENVKAVAAFDKALKRAKSDSERYLVYYNVAVLYASLNKRAKALKYANKAKEIKATDEVIELISKLR